MKPIIGISANEIADAGEVLHHLPVTYLPAGYVKAVQEVGGMPLVLPISDKLDAKRYVDMIDKLILTGGQNVSENFYTDIDVDESPLAMLERDEFELALIEEAIKQKKPIFGVCRGMQLINVYFGGTLHKDLSLRNPEPVKHMQAPVERWVATHDVELEDDSKVLSIYGKITQVNSFHFQSIDKLGKGLKITAKSPDGIIESVESISDNPPILGVQWHPDFSYDVLTHEKEVFRFVVEKL